MYWSAISDGVDLYEDVVNGFIKSISFGIIVTWIAVFEGYDSYPSAEGISSATTRTVVSGSLAVAWCGLHIDCIDVWDLSQKRILDGTGKTVDFAFVR